jgi:acyl carrier protein
MTGAGLGHDLPQPAMSHRGGTEPAAGPGPWLGAHGERIVRGITRCLPPGSSFARDLPIAEAGIDSLRLSQIALEVEDEFRVSLEDRDIEAIFSCATLGEMEAAIVQALARAEFEKCGGTGVVPRQPTATCSGDRK